MYVDVFLYLYGVPGAGRSQHRKAQGRTTKREFQLISWVPEAFASVQCSRTAQGKVETVERAKGRASTKKNLKLEQTPEERAAHPEPLLDKAEGELAGEAATSLIQESPSKSCTPCVTYTGWTVADCPAIC